MRARESIRPQGPVDPREPSDIGDEPPGHRRPETLTIWAGIVRDRQFELRLSGADLDRDVLAAQFEHSSSKRASRPYDPGAMPPPLRGRRHLEVLTPDGPLRLECDRLERERTHTQVYAVTTRPSNALAAAFRAHSSRWTLVAPEGGLADDAEMHDPRPRPIESSKRVDSLRDATLRALSPSQREEVTDRLTAEHMTDFEADFPGPHDRFAFVDLPLEADSRAPGLYAAFLMSETGEITHTVESVTFGRYYGPPSAHAVADPEGDGIDGVLFEIEVDGYAIRWLHFESGEPIVETLAMAST